MALSNTLAALGNKRAASALSNILASMAFGNTLVLAALLNTLAEVQSTWGFDPCLKYQSFYQTYLTAGLE